MVNFMINKANGVTCTYKYHDGTSCGRGDIDDAGRCYHHKTTPKLMCQGTRLDGRPCRKFASAKTKEPLCSACRAVKKLAESGQLKSGAMKRLATPRPALMAAPATATAVRHPEITELASTGAKDGYPSVEAVKVEFGLPGKQGVKLWAIEVNKTYADFGIGNIKSRAGWRRIRLATHGLRQGVNMMRAGIGAHSQWYVALHVAEKFFDPKSPSTWSTTHHKYHEIQRQVRELMSARLAEAARQMPAPEPVAATQGVKLIAHTEETGPITATLPVAAYVPPTPKDVSFKLEPSDEFRALAEGNNNLLAELVKVVKALRSDFELFRDSATAIKSDTASLSSRLNVVQDQLKQLHLVMSGGFNNEQKLIADQTNAFKMKLNDLSLQLGVTNQGLDALVGIWKGEKVE